MQPISSTTTRGVRQRVGLACLIAAVALGTLSGCGGGASDSDSSDRRTTAEAVVASSENWDFERGDFAGWHTKQYGSGAWHAYSNGTSAPDPDDTDKQVPFRVPAAPEGRFAAVTDMMQPGARILHRMLRVDGPSRLRMTLFYEGVPVPFASPQSLDYHTGVRNRQFRVELLDPRAPITSMRDEDRLATVFRTAPGDPPRLRPRTVSLDLSPWAGRTVRLRFAQVDNGGPLRAGVDDIRVAAIGDAG